MDFIVDEFATSLKSPKLEAQGPCTGHRSIISIILQNFLSEIFLLEFTSLPFLSDLFILASIKRRN